MNVIQPRNMLLRYNPQCSLYVYLCIYHMLQPAWASSHTEPSRNWAWDVVTCRQRTEMFSIKTKTFHYDFLWRLSFLLLFLPPLVSLESKPLDHNLKSMDNCHLRAVGLECVWSCYLLYIAPSAQCMCPPWDFLSSLLLAALSSWEHFDSAPVYRVLWKGRTFMIQGDLATRL